MSGAAVCHLTRHGSLLLFGVVQQVPASFSHGQLEVARLSKAFEVAAFRTELAAAIGALPALQTFTPDQDEPGAAHYYADKTRSSFPSLTTGVTGNRLASLEAFLAEYLVRPNAPLKFLGRVKELDVLTSWLDDWNSSQYFVVLGSAGRGKSALLVDWAAKIGELSRFAVVFLPISIRFGLTGKDELARLWLQRLRYILKVSGPLAESPEAWIDEIHYHLMCDRPSSAATLVVVVDGVDEATQPDWFRFPVTLGSRVKIIVSSRILGGEIDSQDALHRLGLSKAQSILLPPLSKSELSEIEELLEGALSSTTKQLWELTLGDPLLVRLYLDWLSDHFEPAPQLDLLAKTSTDSGLARYMRMWWEQVEHEAGEALSDKVSNFLCLLACALGPITTKDLSDAAGIHPLDVQPARRSLRRLLVGDGKTRGYTFSHPRIGYFFAEEFMTETRRSDVDHILSEYCRRVSQGVGNKTGPSINSSLYVLSFSIDHFRRIVAPIDYYEGLLGQGWMLTRRTLDGHYANYLNDIKRVRDEARRSAAVKVEVGCALRIATVISLSAVPPALLSLAVTEELVTHQEAVEITREMSDVRARAITIGLLAPRLDEVNVARLLEIAQQIDDQEIRSIAFAGLAGFLPDSAKEELLCEMREVMAGGSPLLCLLARTCIMKATGVVLPPIDQKGVVTLDGYFSQQIWSKIDVFIVLIEEIMSVLHPSDRDTFTEVVVNATNHREYKWKELDRVQTLIRTVGEHASLDSVLRLQRLLSESSTPAGLGKLLLVARAKVLGGTDNLTDLFEAIDENEQWAAVPFFTMIDDGTRLSLVLSLMSQAQSSPKLLAKHWNDLTTTVPYCPSSLRIEFIRGAWRSLSQIPDSEDINELGAQAMQFIPDNHRSVLADRLAQQLNYPSPWNWRTVATIGKEVSDICLEDVRKRSSSQNITLLALSSRFMREERTELLSRVLDQNYIDIETLEALVFLVKTLPKSESVQLAFNVMQRITGSAEGWAGNRDHSLSWAELIETLAPVLCGTLGEEAASQIEAIVPEITNPPDRALAFASLAVSVSGVKARRLAIAALVAMNDSRSDRQERYGELRIVLHLLPSERSEIASEPSIQEKHLELLDSVRKLRQRTQGLPVGPLFSSQGISLLEHSWHQAIRSPEVSGPSRMELVLALTTLSSTRPDLVRHFWSTGLEWSTSSGRISLVRYLKATLPLLNAITSGDTVEVILENILDVAAWAWR